MSLGQEDLRKAIYELINMPSDMLVCKYMKACTTLRHVLPKGTIRFSPFIEMNDPRETEAQFECDSFLSGSMPPDYFTLQDQYRDDFRHKAIVFCATRDNYSQSDRDLMMRRGFGKMRMWAQYGDNHRGTCLVFQRDLLQASAEAVFGYEKLWCGCIDYDREMLSAGAGAFTFDHEEFRRSSHEYIVDHSKHYRHALFFRKHEDWADEKEWRMATISKGQGGVEVKYKRSLKFIIVGHRVNERVIGEIKRLYDGPVLRLAYQQWKEDCVLNIT